MSMNDLPDFARGYDPYNSVDRFPCGRDSKLINIFSATEAMWFTGPSEEESRAASEFFGSSSAQVVDMPRLNVTIKIPGHPPMSLEGIATDDEFDYTPPQSMFFGEP